MVREGKTFNAFRGGAVHVCATQCKTCIFRPGNPMGLQEGRVEEMVRESAAHQSAIICHDSLGHKGGENLVCRGYFDRHKHDTTLGLAERMGIVRFDSPPKGD